MADDVHYVPQTQSIAVLPFLDLSKSQDQTYIADGLAEELQVSLGQLRGLRVTGRTSSNYFKDKSIELEEIGKRLNVQHVLEGSVQSSGKRVRVSAKLIEVGNGYQLWSDTFELDPEELFSVQDEIAASVSTALSIKLSVGDIGALRGGTRNLDAYQQYLQGWKIYMEGTPQAHDKSLELFRSAVNLDPDYGLAWERIAHINMRLPMIVGPEAAGNSQARSDEALQRALEVAPDSPSVRATATVNLARKGEWAEAQALYEQSLDALQFQSLAAPLHNFGSYLQLVGHNTESIALLERARDVEPLSTLVAMHLGWGYMNAGRLDEADAELERGYQLGSLRFLGLATALAGHSGNPERVEKWGARWSQHPTPVDNVFAAFEEMYDNNPEDTQARYDWLANLYDTTDASSLDSSSAVYAGTHGFPDLALKFMLRSPTDMPLWAPWYADTRRLPGFKDLVRDMGLVDYWREYGWGDFCKPVGDTDFECH